MTLTLLLSAAATLMGLGQSPLAEEGHSHDWVELPDQLEGQTAVHDRNWSGTIEKDGRTLVLALMRVDMVEDDAPLKMDVIVVADCSASKLGFKSVFFHESPYGAGLAVDNSVEEITMDIAAEPVADHDKAIIVAACRGR